MLRASNLARDRTSKRGKSVARGVAHGGVARSPVETGDEGQCTHMSCLVLRRTLGYAVAASSRSETASQASSRAARQEAPSGSSPSRRWLNRHILPVAGEENFSLVPAMQTPPPVSSSVNRTEEEERETQSRSASSSRNEQVDEKLYSRQLYVMGPEAQRRLQGSKVLVTGTIAGLGGEICKNLVLAGIASLDLADDGPCTVGDLGSSFLCTPEDVVRGVSRAAAAVPRLQGLNSYVSVRAVPTLDLASVTSTANADALDCSVAVLIQPSRAALLAWSARAREQKFALVVCGSYGLYAYAASDFGASFEINDTDGEAAKSGLVVGFDESEALVHVHTDKPHRLMVGDSVRFYGFASNASSAAVITVESIKSAQTIGVSLEAWKELLVDATSGSGYFESVKLPSIVTSHTPLASALQDSPSGAGVSSKQAASNANSSSNATSSSNNATLKAPSPPRFVSWVDADPHRSTRLHAYLLALFRFQDANQGRLPRPGNLADAREVLSYMPEAIRRDPKESNEILALAAGAAGQLNPIASLFGGIVAQEALKACSGKFTPLDQWLHFSASECLSRDIVQASNESDYPTLETLAFTGSNSRSVEAVSALRRESQAAVFGHAFNAKFSQLKIFLVGAGALGCETLKNLALMGVENLIVTDPDSIETSNLNRQFLFRPHDVGQNKAETAVSAVKAMMKLPGWKSMNVKVGPDTAKQVFHDDFWDGLDLAVSALDNVPARLFVDAQCVYYGKPLLESGTLGTKANTLPVIPHLTESYGSDPVQESNSSGEGEIPACTLHAYPNLFEHCLTWSRDAYFEKDFTLEPSEAKTCVEKSSSKDYYEALNAQPSSRVERCRRARSVLIGILPSDHPEGLFPFDCESPVSGGLVACVKLARLRFEELFVNKIAQLLAVHPVDKLDKDGNAFWSGKRRAPCVQRFDATNPTHLRFVQASARLYARVFQLDATKLEDEAYLLETIARVAEGLPSFVPNRAVGVQHFPAGDDTKQQAELAAPDSAPYFVDEDEQIKADLARLDAAFRAKPAVRPLVFDKDDPDMLDAVWTAACVRATAYRIPVVPKLEAARVVGSIVPAIATTTAAACGLVGLELYKLLHERRVLEKFRASNLNLAVNLYSSFEPLACKREALGPFGDKTIWTVIELELGDVSCKRVCEHFLKTFGFKVSSIATTGDVSLYNSLFDDDDDDGSEAGEDDETSSRDDARSSDDVMGGAVMPRDVKEEDPELLISNMFRDRVGEEPQSFIPLRLEGVFAKRGKKTKSESIESDESDDEDDIELPAVRLLWKRAPTRREVQP